MPAEFGTYSSNPPALIEERFPLPDGFDRNHLFIAQTKHFIEVVGGAQPICDLNDGVQALRLALGAKESQATGRTVML
jgi:predicted dehydrogenase